MSDSSGDKSLATRFCSNCKESALLNDGGFRHTERYLSGAMGTFSLGDVWDPELDKKHSHILPEATSIGKHSILGIARHWMDSYPDLPNLEWQSRECDMCRFVWEAMTSDDTQLSMADQSRVLGLPRSHSFRIEIGMKWSWGPERRQWRDTGLFKVKSQRVGLDALYLYVSCDGRGGEWSWYGSMLSEGILCALRYSAQSCSNASLADWLRLRSPQRLDWDMQAKAWSMSQFKTCIERHRSCQKLWKRLDAQRPKDSFADGPWLPYRLVRVDVYPPRVVYSYKDRNQGDADWIARYTALSYCWPGLGAVQLKLAWQNEAELMDEIPMGELSAAQRDAIQVTKILGFRYLWNDALCIRQDDPADFARQSSQMGAIYQYAALTIVSLRSSFEQSFLSPDVHCIKLPFTSSLKPSISGSFELVLDGVENTLGGPVLTNKIDKAIPSTRWVTRGWTFQEQNHSLRMLVFWPQGIRFICPYQPSSFRPNMVVSHITPSWKKYRWDDDESSDSDNDVFKNEQDFDRSHTIVRDIYGYTRDNKKYLYFTWLRFATDYSHRVFSKELDVFPALWASARLYRERLRDTYLMGVWNGDFWGLMWCFINREPLCKSLDDVDPGLHLSTWSWIGKPGIKFLNQTGDFCDDLEDFRIEFDNLDYSELKAKNNDPSQGYHIKRIKFLARLTPLKTRYLMCDEFHTNMKLELDEESRFGNAAFCVGWEDEITSSTECSRFSCAMDWRDVEGDFDSRSWDPLKGSTAVFSSPFRFMLLASAKVKGRQGGPRAALGLVLGGNRVPWNIYYRVGIFISKGNNDYGGLEPFDRTPEWVVVE